MSASELQKHLDFADHVVSGTLFPKNSDVAAVYADVLPSISAYGLKLPTRPFFDLAGRLADAAADSSPARRDLNAAVVESAYDSRDTFRRAYQLSVQYPTTFGRAYVRNVAHRYLKAPPTASIEDLLGLHPELNDKIPKGGAGEKRSDAARNASRDIGKRLQTRASAAIRDLHDSPLNPATSDADDSASREARQRAVERIIRDYDDAIASVSIVSSLMILTRDPQLARIGRDFAVMGTATANMTKAIALYSAGATSGVALAATVLTSTAMLSSLMGGAEPSPELAQLHALQLQIAQLRREMHERFDLVDAKLNVLMGAIDRNYRAILRVDANLSLAREAISDQADTLRSISSRTAHGFESLSQQGLRLSSAQCIDHLATFRTALPFDRYSQCLLTYHTLATDLAANEIYQPLQGRRLDDRSLFDELSTAPDKNLRYIDAYLGQRFAWQPHASLVSPVAWQAGAEGLIELARQWPDYFYRRTNAKPTLLSVIRKGELLDDMAQALGGHSIRERRRFFNDSLVAHYASKLDALLRAIGASRGEFYSTKALGSGTSEHAPALVEIPNCPGFNYNQQPGWGISSPIPIKPVQALTAVVPEFYRSIEERGLGALSVCYSGARVASDGQPGDNDGRWMIDIDIVVSIGPVTLFSDTLREREVQGKLQALFETGVLWNRTFQASFRRRLAERLSSEPVRAAALSYVVAQLRKDEEIERDCNRRIGKELIDADTPIHAAATELSGAKALLDAVFAIGLPVTHANREDLRYHLGPEGLPDRDQLVRYYGCFARARNACQGAARAVESCIAKSGIEAIARAELYRARDTMDDVIATSPLSQRSPTIAATLARLRLLYSLWEYKNAKCQSSTAEALCLN